ncbi:hypothetical protein BVC80_8919g26 [Macleaya cordata]|uniref:Uncharacterized protein n=1 Tax=Macleaya cordata TaxID=56857 RepID=A0A200Q8A2_MACCD|nr:hypothetical protein BVC80_8919g26 [Macleaya cordata]
MASSFFSSAFSCFGSSSSSARISNTDHHEDMKIYQSPPDDKKSQKMKTKSEPAKRRRGAPIPVSYFPINSNLSRL